MIDYRNFFHDDVELADAVIGWLVDHPHPMARHRVAYSTNWDFGFRVLGWIASQPSCDRATATHVFWAALPHEVIDPSDEWYARRVGDPSDVYHLLELIVDRLGEGHYQNEEFETQWSKEWEQGVKEYAKLVERSPALDPKWRRALSLVPLRPIYEWNAHPAYPEGVPHELYGSRV
jgi:hypothetical protein